jgi:uncharacterized membrane protein YdjX (TVP38/TMEM64 family)
MGSAQLRLLIKGLLLMGSLVVIGWALHASGLIQHLDQNWVDHEIRGQGGRGWVIYGGLGALAMAAGLPRQAVCILGGYAFGLGEGLVLALGASLLGCLVCFLYARLFGRELVRHRFERRLSKLDDFLRGHPMVMTMLVRFLPGNNLITNLLAGVSSVPLLPFLAGSLVGYLPQTIIFVLLGSGIHVQPFWRTAVSIVLYLASTLLGVYLYRRLRHGHSLDEALDEPVTSADVGQG